VRLPGLLVGTTGSVISRLESAEYDGHSLKMLERIAVAFRRKNWTFKRIACEKQTASRFSLTRICYQDETIRFRYPMPERLADIPSPQILVSSCRRLCSGPEKGFWMDDGSGAVII